MTSVQVEPSERYGISVVIPAYKPDFLKCALTSLARQSDRAFEVVIADDGSPHDLRSICEDFRGVLDLSYRRFDENLGRANLCAHWNRAVQLARHDWIWFMGDDDELQQNCVRVMRAALAADPGFKGLWRVNVERINASGETITPAKTWPELCAKTEYLRMRLKQEIDSYACEYVFRRTSLEEGGGFVAFPLAWCSDDATWIVLAGSSGIRTVTGYRALARWRSSDRNISGGGAEFARAKWEARVLYAEWLERNLLRQMCDSSHLLQEEISLLLQTWLLDAMLSTRTRLSLLDCARLARRLTTLTQVEPWRNFYRLVRVQRWIAHRLTTAGSH